MGWLFGRKKRVETDGEPGSLATLALFDLENRFFLIERAIHDQNAMLDERTRVMAEAMSTELRAVGRIIADLARNMAELNAKLDGLVVEVQPDPLPEPNAGAATPSPVASPAPSPSPAPRAETARLPERVREKAEIDDLAILAPPPPANDPPRDVRRDVDPMLLDALAKGRIAFDLTRITTIPPRAPLLALMRFAPPLPDMDVDAVDRLAAVFPDAALLLDRLMIDAAASMVRMGQIPADLPLLVPLSPVSVSDPVHAADFRRRFERAPHAAGVFPLLSEPGWIALVEAGDTRMAELGGARSGFAIRVSGQQRVDHAAIGMLGARYVLAPAAALSAPGRHPLAPDIHGADVARLFARAGVGLVAENVPDQVSVLGLLRNGIGMGWGPALQLEQAAPPPAPEPVEEPTRLDYRAYLRRAGS